MESWVRRGNEPLCFSTTDATWTAALAAATWCRCRELYPPTVLRNIPFLKLLLSEYFIRATEVTKTRLYQRWYSRVSAESLEERFLPTQVITNSYRHRSHRVLVQVNNIRFGFSWGLENITRKLIAGFSCNSSEKVEKIICCFFHCYTHTL